MTKKEAMKYFNLGKYRLEYFIQDGVIGRDYENWAT
jgi:hypothetical protein